MKNIIRNAMLSVAVAGMACIGAAAQSSSPSTTTQGSASTSKHHAGANNESNAGSSKLDAVDRHFIRKAGEGGLAEVELGKLAAEKGATDEVKKFGQRMVDDHTKANEQLKDVAAQKHIDLPTEPSAKDKATKARLEKLSGEQFDRAYMRDMVMDHKTDVSEFARESQSAKDPALKNFARQTLPTLRQHLKEAEKLAPQQKNQQKKTTAQNNGMKPSAGQ